MKQENDQLASSLKRAEDDIKDGRLDADEKKALQKFRDEELNRKIKETPIWVKITWGVIFFGMIYYFNR